MPDRPATFAALLATAAAAHNLADHVLGQTDAQAAAKERDWAALARHVGAYHAVMATMVGLTVRGTGLRVSARGLAAGLVVSAGTHALWDRRAPVRWVLEHTGSAPFARQTGAGINGMYLSDQALHAGSIWLATLVAVTVGDGKRRGNREP